MRLRTPPIKIFEYDFAQDIIVIFEWDKFFTLFLQMLKTNDKTLPSKPWVKKENQMDLTVDDEKFTYFLDNIKQN